MDGEAIIQRAVRGEASAFGLLYDQYQPKIFRFVILKVGRREEAEDLTHQVFLNAWQNIHSYKPRGFPFSSWLYRIARNQVIDYYRANGSRPEVSLDDIHLETIADPRGGEVSPEQVLQLEAVRRALPRLKPDYQDVLIMRFVEELSIKETAAAIKKSEGAVKVIQHRALKELRTILVHEKIFEGYLETDEE